MSSRANKRDIRSLSSAEAPAGYPYKNSSNPKNRKRAGDDGMADNRSKNMNCKKSVKQNRNPFYTIIFTTAFKSIQMVGWFSQNHRTANPAREPHIIWQRGLSSLFPFPIVPRALSFSFSSASPQHKEASREERDITLNGAT